MCSRVGPSVTNLGYNLRDSWWGVPRFGSVKLAVIAKQFDKLREVGLSREHILDSALVEVEAIRGELEPGIGNSALQIGKKGYVVSAVRLPITQDTISFVSASRAINAH